jgi:hypothetical protein
MGMSPFMLGGTQKRGEITMGEALYGIGIFGYHEMEKSSSATKIVLDHYGTRLFNKREIRGRMSHIPRKENRD